MPMPRGNSEPPPTRRGRVPGWVPRAAGVAVSCALTVVGALAVAVGVLAGDTAPAEEPARSSTRPRPAPDPETGSLEGTVLLGPKLSSRKMRFHLYADAPEPAAARSGPEIADELRNVVVYLESSAPASASTGAARAPASHVVRQENLAFVPHVLTVLKGSTVEFPNSDPIFHNVFSLSRAASFDLGRYPKGASKSVRFDETGMVNAVLDQLARRAGERRQDQHAVVVVARGDELLVVPALFDDVGEQAVEQHGRQVALAGVRQYHHQGLALHLRLLGQA